MQDLSKLPGLQLLNQEKPGQEQVELFLSCRQLKNMDALSLTDPQVRIYTIDNGKETLFGQTEMILDNLNPNFATTFKMNYQFEVKQNLRFEVIDIDGPNKWELVGNVYTTLGEIVGSKNSTAIFDIKNKNKVTGKLIIRSEKVNTKASSIVYFQIHGRKLTNKNGWFSTSSPYFKFARMTGDAGNVVVYTSETIKKNLNPQWAPFSINLQTLCNGDLMRPVSLEVYTRKRFTEKLIGSCIFTLDELINQEKRQFVLSKPDKKKKYGIIEIKSFSIQEQPSFLDYLRGGVQLSVIVAIDFTGSNGIPTRPESLHYISPNGELNQYQKAIEGVCDILLCYDHDKKVPMYGFGAKPFGRPTSHCFSLTGDEKNPWAYGLDGIMQVYQKALKNVELDGPTHFHRVLQQAMAAAKTAKAESSNEYIILLILTDGMIHDMEETINCLINSAYLPLSVIIVGIGNADFKEMEILDGDNGLENSLGVKAKRDLVQFVPFNKFGGDKETLAKEVLAEVPTQLLEYMQSMKIAPVKGQEVDMNKILVSKQSIDSVNDQAMYHYARTNTTEKDSQRDGKEIF